MAKIYLEFYQRLAWDASIKTFECEPNSFGDTGEVELEFEENIGANLDFETRFGPFRDIEAAREAIRRWKEEDTGEYGVWSDEAYEDLYEGAE